MNASNLIAPLVGLIVGASTSSVVEDTAKLLTPKNLSNAGSFGWRIGGMVLGGIASTIVGGFAVNQMKSIVTTVNEVGTSEEDTIEETN